ncbi:MAG: glycosyltransferase family protein [Planctomycetota bacterium]|jgi:hypothetical protein
MDNTATIVHVTHEATGKIGGIGAVLKSLCTCKAYLSAVNRTIITGPLFTTDVPASDRLGEGGDILYSSLDGIEKTKYANAFKMIERYYNAGIVYGTKTFDDKDSGIESKIEILLIDVRYVHAEPVNELKKQMYNEFDIQSDLYEHIWECEQYIRMAPAAIATLKEIGAAGNFTTIIAHEFMGMATALAGILEPACEFKTVFYAHEVATMRRIAENHPGYDTMFYNALEEGIRQNLYVNDVFGEQSNYFKHAFVSASKYCDGIFAVGDYVVKELKFMGPEFEQANINIVYNGIPAYKISFKEKLESRAKLQKYCENLLDYRPDFVFTHVTRLVPSKGLWRDLNVLHSIEQEFRKQNKTAVLFILSTETAQRSTDDILGMESEYNWPIAHHDGLPDLTGGESLFYEFVQTFNSRSRNIKTVFINQFGFSRQNCGTKMPQDMEFMDIRKGSDLEFGLSIYEPFGIAQLETLAFGGICALSKVCGCTGFLDDILNGQEVKNVIIPDYVSITCHPEDIEGINDILKIDQALRHWIEHTVSRKLGLQILSQLPQNEHEMKVMLKSGYNIARKMNWDVVVKNYLLPALEGLKQKCKCEQS